MDVASNDRMAVKGPSGRNDTIGPASTTPAAVTAVFAAFVAFLIGNRLVIRPTLLMTAFFHSSRRRAFFFGCFMIVSALFAGILDLQLAVLVRNDHGNGQRTEVAWLDKMF